MELGLLTFRLLNFWTFKLVLIMDKPKKVAIAHDWLTGMRGGEKCLEVFCELFPDATLFTLIHDKGKMSETIENMDIKTSFIQKMPFALKKYRNFLPFFPAAIESFDLSEYDLVLSSSHCVAKGAKKNPNALHICYCYTPVRYVWKFFDEYSSKDNPIKRFLIRKVMDGIKKWDLNSNKMVDCFVAISDNIKNRIKFYYNRDSDVIYPPVDTLSSSISSRDDGYYLIVSALVPYKRVDLAVNAFSKSGRCLIVIGDGGEMGSLKKCAAKNVEFLGWVDDKKLREYYSNCSALIFPGDEDFGIVPLEAQLRGKPVIAFKKGGVLETVIPYDGSGKGTGIFFDEQTESSLNKAVELFEKEKKVFRPENIRANAERFNRGRFKREIEEYISDKWEEHIRP